MNIDLIFKGMREAQVSFDKDWMHYGSYVVELTDMRVKDSQKDGLPVFICRFKVLESNNPEDPVGANRSWTLKGKSLQYGISDIKALMFAIAGVDAGRLLPTDPAHEQADLLFRYVLGSESAKKELEALAEDERPAADFYVGARVRLETKPKAPDKPFTRHFWGPAPAAEGAAA